MSFHSIEFICILNACIGQLLGFSPRAGPRGREGFSYPTGLNQLGSDTVRATRLAFIRAWRPKLNKGGPLASPNSGAGHEHCLKWLQYFQTFEYIRGRMKGVIKAVTASRRHI